jgi:hypothetical protein
MESDREEMKPKKLARTHMQSVCQIAMARDCGAFRGWTGVERDIYIGRKKSEHF